MEESQMTEEQKEERMRERWDNDDLGEILTLYDANGRIVRDPAIQVDIATGEDYIDPLTENERGSFFATCHRSEKGWCEEGEGEPAGGIVSTQTVEKVSAKELKAARAKARAKAAEAPAPTKADVKEANRRIDLLGADDYEANIRGNSKDRAVSRLKLLKEFGDGKHCPCIYCGDQLGVNTVTRDKIYTARQGGRYNHKNLVPACVRCNQARGDTKWENIVWG